MTAAICSGAVRAIRSWRTPIAALGASIAMLAAQPPLAANVTQALAADATHDHWMADMGHARYDRLGQVILPASHDSGTYALQNGLAAGGPPVYAMVQDVDIYTQLQDGIRVLDLRGRDFEGQATEWDLGLPALIQTRNQQLTRDYYVYHGPLTSTLPLASALDDVARWVVAPGHDKEVVIVQVSTAGDNPQRLSDICSSFKQKLGPILLDTDTFATAAKAGQHFSYTGTDLAQNTVDDVWNLPGHQRVILRWDGCGPSWPAGTFNGYWANQCYAQSYNSAAFDRPGIVGALQPALDGRLSALGADGLQGGAGKIATRPSTMPESSPRVGTSSTVTTSPPFLLDAGTYAVAYAWLSPLGETQPSPVNNFVIAANSNGTTHAIEVSLPSFPAGVTGAAIYMSTAGGSTLTQQGQTTTATYRQTTPPTTTGQSPTTSVQLGYTRDTYGSPVRNGFYSLGMHASLTGDCALPMDWFLPQQVIVLDTVKGWFDSNQNHASDNLNIISADFVERSSLVDYAIKMNTPKD